MECQEVCQLVVHGSCLQRKPHTVSFDLCTRMMPNTVVTDFGNRGGQCQGGRLLYLVKLLYVISKVLHFQFALALMVI